MGTLQGVFAKYGDFEHTGEGVKCHKIHPFWTSKRVYFAHFRPQNGCFNPDFKVFLRTGDPFKYTRGHNDQNTNTIDFHPIGRLGQRSMKWQKWPKWPYFGVLAENTLKWLNFRTFRPKVPFSDG